MITTTKTEYSKAKNGRRGKKVFPDTKEGKKQAEAEYRRFKKSMDGKYGKNPKTKAKRDAKRKSLATRRVTLGLSKPGLTNGRIVKRK
jgi:hypothetical protein